MKVKVWNDNRYPYRENFRDQKIDIPPKSYIEMELEDAIIFKGTINAVKVDTNNIPMEESYKMIRIEHFKPEDFEKVKLENKPKEHVCIACNYEASSKADLDEHVTASHLSDMLDEKEVEKRRGPGRPKKGDATVNV